MTFELWKSKCLWLLLSNGLYVFMFQRPAGFKDNTQGNLPKTLLVGLHHFISLFDIFSQNQSLIIINYA